MSSEASRLWKQRSKNTSTLTTTLQNRFTGQQLPISSLNTSIVFVNELLNHDIKQSVSRQLMCVAEVVRLLSELLRVRLPLKTWLTEIADAV